MIVVDSPAVIATSARKMMPRFTREASQPTKTR
jgi:hypothetical protein